MASLNGFAPIDCNLRLLLIPKEKKPTPEKKDQNYKTNQKIIVIAAATVCAAAALFGILLARGFLFSREVPEPNLPFARIDLEVKHDNRGLARQLCQYTEDLCKKGLGTLEKCTAFGQKCLNLEFHEEIKSVCKEIAENRCVDIEGEKFCLKEILSEVSPTVHQMSATQIICSLHLKNEYDPKLFDGVNKDLLKRDVHFFTAELPKKITDYFSFKFNEVFPQTKISWDSLKLKLEVDNTLEFYQKLFKGFNL